APLRRAHDRAAAAAARLAEREASLATAEQAAAGAAATTERAEAVLAETATDLHLPADQDGLDAVRDALGAYRTVTTGLWPALLHWSDQLAALARAAAEHATATADAAERAALADAQELAAVEAEAALAALRATA